jgi:hypothetical protein
MYLTSMLDVSRTWREEDLVRRAFEANPSLFVATTWSDDVLAIRKQDGQVSVSAARVHTTATGSDSISEGIQLGA